MRTLLYLLPLLVLNCANAGSLGKYQIELIEVQPRQTKVFNAPTTINPTIKKKVAAKEQDPQKEFYQKFSIKARSLSGTDKQTWLANYKGELENAFRESPVDTGKVRHYTQLVEILQTLPEQ